MQTYAVRAVAGFGKKDIAATRQLDIYQLNTPTYCCPKLKLYRRYCTHVRSTCMAVHDYMNVELCNGHFEVNYIRRRDRAQNMLEQLIIFLLAVFVLAIPG